MNRFCTAFLLGALAVLSASANPIDIHLDRYASRFNLGVAPFTIDDRRDDQAFADAVRAVVIDDLTFMGIFNLVTEGQAVSDVRGMRAWAMLGSEVVLTATVRSRAGRPAEVEARLLDTGNGREVLRIRKQDDGQGARRLAHHLANDVVKYFTGQEGIFLSRIAFVNDATGRKELYVVDFDGKNPVRLTNDNSIVILPRLAPDGERMVFTSYISGNPDLYMINTDRSGRRRISSNAGLNVSPSWAPAGDRLALTLSIHGPPNIYLMDTNGRIERRLTNSPGADTAPSFSPDGSQIVFTSDRRGPPHIFLMNLDGSGLRRLTTIGYCDSAAWSPDGQTILYVKSEGGGRFEIYSIEVLTGIERRLTWGPGNSENPAWSPDSRFIVFVATRRGKSELFVMNADGSDPRPLFTNTGQSFTPHWSR